MDDASGEAVEQLAVARFDRDGRLDTGFGAGSEIPGTAVTAIDGGGAGRAVAVQADGKPLVAGLATGTNITSIAVARFLSSDSQSDGDGDGGDGDGTGARCADGDSPTTETVSELLQVRACIERETAQRWVLRGRKVRLNGLILHGVDPRARIVLDRANKRVYSEHPAGGDARVRVSLPDIGIRLFTRKLDIPYGEASTIAEERTAPDQSLFGLKIEGTASVSLARAGSGFPPAVLVDLQVKLPEIFQGTQGAVRIRADIRNGVFLDGLEVAAKQALIGPLRVDDFLLRFSLAADLWEGKAKIYIGDARLEVAVAMGFRPFRLDSFMAAIENLNEPVASGVFLQDVFVSLTTKPLELTGAVRLTAGPKVGKLKAVEIVGNFLFQMPDNPAPDAPKWNFRIDGNLSVAGLEAGSGFVAADSNAFVEAGVQFKQDFVIGQIDVNVNGWIDGLRAFNFEGSGSLCIGGCAGVEAVVSSKGVAACLGFSYTDEDDPGLSFTFGLGLGVTWDPPVPSVMFLVCSIGPYREARPASLRGASSFTALTQGRAAQVQQQIELPGGLPLAAISAIGQSEPPDLVITGPNGERISTAGTPLGFTQRKDHVVLRSPADRTLYVALVRPAAGTWTIEQAPGSDPIVEIGSGNGRKPVSVKADVGGGGSASAARTRRVRTLRYSIKRQPGMVVRFVEQSGGVARILGSAQKARGTLRFTPADGPAGQRRIVAVVEQDGLPRESVEVDRYRAPGPFRPAAPRRLRAVRRGSRLKLTWRAVPRAEEYVVRVRVSDGRRLLGFVPRKRRSFVVREFRREDRARVTVRGRTASLREGRPAKKRVSKEQRKRKKRRRG